MLRAFRISSTPTRPYESGNEFPIRRSSNTKLIANTQLQMGVIAKSKGTESRISTVCRATSFLTASLPTIRASRKNRMQLRHAAALALVGWYLLVPPSMNGSGNLNAKAPLAQWINEGAFDRADECESARANGATATAGGATSEQQIKSLREMFAHAQCIGTDDPRLKPKVK